MVGTGDRLANWNEAEEVFEEGIEVVNWQSARVRLLSSPSILVRVQAVRTNG